MLVDLFAAARTKATATTDDESTGAANNSISVVQNLSDEGGRVMGGMLDITHNNQLMQEVWEIMAPSLRQPINLGVCLSETSS